MKAVMGRASPTQHGTHGAFVEGTVYPASCSQAAANTRCNDTTEAMVSSVSQGVSRLHIEKSVRRSCNEVLRPSHFTVFEKVYRDMPGLSRTKRVAEDGVNGGVLKQRRNALGGRFPSLSNLAAFAGSSDEDLGATCDQRATMRRCSSESSIQSAAAESPWKTYETWRESNPQLPRSMCRTFAESLLPSIASVDGADDMPPSR
jgi:hypothetical protein